LLIAAWSPVHLTPSCAVTSDAGLEQGLHAIHRRQILR
jgi:hypothetical protein